MCGNFICSSGFFRASATGNTQAERRGQIQNIDCRSSSSSLQHLGGMLFTGYVVEPGWGEEDQPHHKDPWIGSQPPLSRLPGELGTHDLLPWVWVNSVRSENMQVLNGLRVQW